MSQMSVTIALINGPVMAMLMVRVHFVVMVDLIWGWGHWMLEKEILLQSKAAFGCAHTCMFRGKWLNTAAPGGYNKCVKCKSNFVICMLFSRVMFHTSFDVGFVVRVNLPFMKYYLLRIL